ncbi:MAG TPA: tRNA dihydrouridine synthase DusB [Acholeplasmataceae bacterium]|nr:tRNA dihydrouridine synthase DusB [Acholeplasmataceae bacterium]HRX45072.1 tRNA dihydrouridine synthase DusB [Acholeplasmataceae bacterium]
MAFKIGHLVIENQLILAPMAGVSNSPFRKLSRDFGAGLVYAEMVSDKGLMYDNERTKKILYMTDEEKPMAQQIFGSDLETMVQAALYIDKNSNCDIIDINMGCPVPKVAIKAQAGASLMKNPDLIYDIVSEIVKKVSKPVTVKIRSGWDNQSVNAVLVAKRIEEAGASAITVHARTRSQGYSGHADLDVIKAVKEAVKIPVIGNGDVIDGPSAKYMLEYTGCDAVMIGRGALGNPWIFREINAYLKDGTIFEKPSHEELKEMMLQHLDSLVELKGERTAVLEMRSHGPWYLKGIEHASHLRKQLSQARTRDEFKMYVEAFFSEHR